MTNCRFESSNYYLLFHIFISRFGSSSLHDFTSPLCFVVFIIRITFCYIILRFHVFTSTLCFVVFIIRILCFHAFTSPSPSPPASPTWEDFFYRLLDNNFTLIGQWIVWFLLSKHTRDNSGFPLHLPTTLHAFFYKKVRIAFTNKLT